MKMLITQEELKLKKSRDLIPFECESCKNTFYRTKNLVLRAIKGTKPILCCSKKCLFLFKTKLRINCNCFECYKPVVRKITKITGGNIFCSTKCSAIFLSRKRIIIRKCLNCQKEVRNNKYCSKECYRKFNSEMYAKKWLSGELLFNKSKQAKIPQTVRRFIFQQANYKCSKCGWSEKNIKTQKVPLQLHHIDGDYRNNKPENIEVLCPNCHSITPTFAALNKGFGRKYRKN
jgi:endogenous inhibitor of DNA gyrase (YacG/DUF329 family)